MKLDRSSAPSVLVIPVFNEAQRIDFEFFSAIKNINFDQIIFVDDGSTDLSFQIINDFFVDDPRVEWIHNSSNLGKAESLRLGILKASIKSPVIVVITDADGAISHVDITKIVTTTRRMIDNSLSKIEVLLISGARVNLAGWQIERNVLRQWIVRIVATVVALVCKTSMYDTQSPLKALYFSNASGSTILFERFKTKWFYEAELVMRINNIGTVTDNPIHSAIHEFPLTYFRDVPGGKLRIRSGFSVFRQLLTLYMVSR